jgi:TatD DNase family protein
MYDESIRVAPLDKILSETDSPFAAPVPNRGKRNEPAYVEEVVKKIAKIKGETPEVITEHIYRNAHKVFNLQ